MSCMQNEQSLSFLSNILISKQRNKSSIFPVNSNANQTGRIDQNEAQQHQVSHRLYRTA